MKSSGPQIRPSNIVTRTTKYKGVDNGQSVNLKAAVARKRRRPTAGTSHSGGHGTNATRALLADQDDKCIISVCSNSVSLQGRVDTSARRRPASTPVLNLHGNDCPGQDSSRSKICQQSCLPEIFAEPHHGQTGSCWFQTTCPLAYLRCLQGLPVGCATC